MQHYVYGLYKKNCAYSTYHISENLFYVGISSDKNIYFRERNHKSCNSNKHKLAIINKYDFFLKILWSLDSREEAEEREAFLIRFFKDQLCNINLDSRDMTYARSRTKKPKSQWKRHSLEDRISNRDRNLTIPYADIISLINEWITDPKESQTSFAKRKNISRCMFKDWLRLYFPQYLGLAKKWQLEKWNQINKDNKKPTDIIKELSELTGYSYIQSKSLYYRFINNQDSDSTEKKSRQK